MQILGSGGAKQPKYLSNKFERGYTSAESQANLDSKIINMGKPTIVRSDEKQKKPVAALAGA